MLFPCTCRNQQASEVLLKFFKQNMRKCWHHSKILKAQTILLDNIYSIVPKGFLKLPLVQHLHPPVNLLLPPNPSKRSHFLLQEAVGKYPISLHKTQMTAFESHTSCHKGTARTVLWHDSGRDRERRWILSDGYKRRICT